MRFLQLLEVREQLRVQREKLQKNASSRQLPSFWMLLPPVYCSTNTVFRNVDRRPRLRLRRQLYTPEFGCVLRERLRRSSEVTVRIRADHCLDGLHVDGRELALCLIRIRRCRKYKPCDRSRCGG